MQVECFGTFLTLIFGTFGEKRKVFKHSHCILFFWCFMNWPETHSMSSYFVNTRQGMFKQAYQFSKSHYDGVMVYWRCMHSTECSKYFFRLPLFAVFVVGARNAILKGASGYIRVVVRVNNVWINCAPIDNATLSLLKVYHWWYSCTLN